MYTDGGGGYATTKNLDLVSDTKTLSPNRINDPTDSGDYDRILFYNKQNGLLPNEV